MRKLILALICALTTVQAISQDSARVTITPQARDLEYIGSFVYNDNGAEEVYDSIKVKFRKVNPPTGNSQVQVTAYAIDWAQIAVRLKSDITAIYANTTQRLETLLRASGNAYLIGILDNFDTKQAERFINMRNFGRDRLRRNGSAK